MESDGQPNEETGTEQTEEQQEAPEESETTETQTEEQEDKPARARRRKAPCPDCVNKAGVSTGLQSASTLCSTCDGSGLVKAVV